MFNDLRIVFPINSLQNGFFSRNVCMLIAHTATLFSLSLTLIHTLLRLSVVQLLAARCYCCC